MVGPPPPPPKKKITRIWTDVYHYGRFSSNIYEVAGIWYDTSECNGGTAVAQWLRRCATNRKVAGSIPAGVGGFFVDIKSFRSHYGPGVDSAYNRNEYQISGQILD